MGHQVPEDIDVLIVAIPSGIGRSVAQMLEVLLEVVETHFVPVFILAIVLGVFLDCIICQVDVFIVQLIDVELLATCPDVSIFIKVSFQASIDACHKAIAPEIELS